MWIQLRSAAPAPCGAYPGETAATWGHTVLPTGRLHSAMQAKHRMPLIARTSTLPLPPSFPCPKPVHLVSPNISGLDRYASPVERVDICRAIQSTGKETEQTQVFIKGCTQRKRKRKGTSNYKTVDCILVTAVLFKIHGSCSEGISESYSAGSWHPVSVLHVPCHHERANYCLRYGVLLLRLSLSCLGLHSIPVYPRLLCADGLHLLLDPLPHGFCFQLFLSGSFYFS